MIVEGTMRHHNRAKHSGGGIIAELAGCSTDSLRTSAVIDLTIVGTTTNRQILRLSKIPHDGLRSHGICFLGRIGSILEIAVADFGCFEVARIGRLYIGRIPPELPTIVIGDVTGIGCAIVVHEIDDNRCVIREVAEVIGNTRIAGAVQHRGFQVEHLHVRGTVTGEDEHLLLMSRIELKFIIGGAIVVLIAPVFAGGDFTRGHFAGLRHTVHPLRLILDVHGVVLTAVIVIVVVNAIHIIKQRSSTIWSPGDAVVAFRLRPESDDSSATSILSIALKGIGLLTRQLRFIPIGVIRPRSTDEGRTGPCANICLRICVCILVCRHLHAADSGVLP